MYHQLQHTEIYAFCMDLRTKSHYFSIYN